MEQQTAICGSFVQQIGRERWEDAMAGSADPARGRQVRGVIFSLWSHFLAVYLQGSETAGGGNVLALAAVRTVHVGCKEDEPRSALLH